MKYNSQHNGFAKKAARTLAVIITVCLALAVIPSFTTGFAPSAKAATVTYTPATGSNVNAVNTQLASYEAGTVVNMILSENIDFTDTSSDAYPSEKIGIVIPSGITVNLYLNSKNISFSHPSDGNWQLFGAAAIINKGTLNVYSGSGPSAPNTSAANASASAISVVNVRTNMSSGSSNECAYSRCDAIRNEGTLTVNKNVTLAVNSDIRYKDVNSGWPDEGSATAAATCIFNTSLSAQCVINAATLSASTTANSISSNSRHAESRAFSYGIYGGQITVNGESQFSTTSTVRNSESGSVSNKEGTVTGVAYGIASGGHITVNGGTFSYNASTSSDHNGLEKGYQRIYVGGILYKTGTMPVITDGTVNTITTTVFNYTSGNITYNESVVAVSDTLPHSGADLFGTASGNVYSTLRQDSHPTTAISAGQFLDECGNSYTTNIATAANTHPTALIRGALSGTYRVHVVYRYWTSAAKTAIDTSIVGSDGNVGYSYMPLADNTNVVNSKVVLSGITASNKLTKDKDSAIAYVSGGDSCNQYYWAFNNLSYAATSTVFSDYNVTSTANRGSVFRSFSSTGAANSSVGSGQTTPIYIFVDYYRIEATSIVASAGTNDVATMTYTGYNAKAATDFPFTIKDGVYFTDFTSEYNVDFTDSSKMSLSFSYTGTTAAGNPVSGTSGELPKDAGTYQVTLDIAACTTYNKEPAVNKNRYALNYTFTLIINQAEPARGTLPAEISFTYGDTLGAALHLSEYTATGAGADGNVQGSFAFTNPSDGTGYKPVGVSTVSVTWTPVYSSTALAKNYKQVTFTLFYTCTKAPLTVSPNAALVSYGENEFTTPFSSVISGLVGNDNTDAVRATLQDALNYMILVNGSYVAYSTDDINVGSYDIRATFSSVPAVLNNYTYSYVFGAESNPGGTLTVAKRNIVVTATAVNRVYEPGNYNVNVTFAVTSGKYNSDDVRVLPATGALEYNSVGTQNVNGITKLTVTELLTGGAAANYNVQAIEFASGANLTVVISKASPTATLPIISDMYYRASRTLADVALVGFNASVAGSWQWVDSTINPTVGVSAYQAKFVPADQTNYETKYETINFNVLQTTVNVTYNTTVSYGDAVPNITAYSYSAPNDPGFDINAVQTVGNISPSTSYTKGSPVIEGGYAVTLTAPNFKDKAENYVFAFVNGSITVTPKVITFTVKDESITYGSTFSTSSSARSVTYDASQLVGTDTLTAVTSDGSEPVFTYSTDYRYADNYAVGTYYIRGIASFTTSPNYSVEVLDGTLTVTRADLIIRGNTITLPFNSDVPELTSAYTIEGAKRNETINEIVTSGAISVDSTYYKGADVNGAGYPISVDISEAVIANYNVTVQSGKIIVIKADPVISTYPTAAITYGQTLSEAVFSGAVIADDVAGTFSYNSAYTVPAYSATPYTIYAATFIPNDSANYNSVTNLYISLYVNKMPISGTLTVSGTPMVGDTLSVDVSGLNPSELGVYTYSWYNGATLLATGNSYTLAEADKGYSLTIVAVANGYYEGSVSCTTTTISPMLTSVNVILAADKYADYFNIAGLSPLYDQTTVTYNGLPQGADVTLLASKLSSVVVGDITVKYNGSTVVPITNGYYSVTIDVATPAGISDMNIQADASGYTYDTITGKYVYAPVSNYYLGTLYIAKADYHAIVTVGDKVYDGYNTAYSASVEEYGAAILIGGTQDDVYFDTSSAVYSFSDANVGTAKSITYGNVKLAGSAADNYNLIMALAYDGKADITPRTLNVSVIPESRAYEKDNYNVALSFFIEPSSIAPADSTALVHINELTALGHIDSYLAGNRNVIVSGVELTGSKASNYTLKLTNLTGLTVEITKAVPDYPLPQTGVLYYDSAKTLSDISLGDSRWAWDASVSAIVPTAGTHVYKAVYTPDDIANFAKVNYDVTVEVNKTLVTVTAANYSIGYGDGEPTYYYTATGFTGSDTVKNAVSGYTLLSCAYEQGSDVGNYAVVLTGAFDSNNYSFKYVNGNVTVSPRVITTTAVAVARPYESGNLEVDVNFTALANIYAGDSTSVYLYGTYPITGHISTDTAGYKAVSYTAPVLAGAKASNYVLKITNTALTVEIQKAVLEGIVLPATGEVTYGQKLSTTQFTSSYEGEALGTFSMENASSTPAACGTFNNVYRVVFTPTDKANYAQIIDYITLTVDRANLDISISLEGTTRIGYSLHAIVSGLPTAAQDKITVEWYRLNNADDDPVYQGYKIASGVMDYTLTKDDIGSVIAVVITENPDSPYICSARTVSDGEIQGENLTFWQRIWNWFYKILSSMTQIFAKIGG